MPIYEYACDKCEVVHEDLRNVNNMNDPYACNECREVCRKVMSRPAGFRFGGSDGIIHEHRLAADRKKQYWNSSAGKDELGAQKAKLAKKYGAI